MFLASRSGVSVRHLPSQHRAGQPKGIREGPDTPHTTGAKGPIIQTKPLPGRLKRRPRANVPGRQLFGSASPELGKSSFSCLKTAVSRKRAAARNGAYFSGGGTVSRVFSLMFPGSEVPASPVPIQRRKLQALQPPIFDGSSRADFFYPP